MTLDIFDIKLGPDAVMPRLDGETTGLVAVQVLDAIQTVVDVLVDSDTGKGWDVSFDPTINAYTDRSAKRRIVVSVKPLLDAKPGDKLAKVAAVMTGFAVHEVGHTKLNFYDAISERWPGKVLPKTLGNVIEDVVLEQRTVERYPGFADHGGGNVFRPTLEWVAKETCPTYPLKWNGSTGHKVNVVGQIVRYRDFVTFDLTDEATAKAVEFVEQWAQGITSGLTPSGCVSLIEDMLAYMKATRLEDETPEGPTPPTTDCPIGPPSGKQQIPNEDDDDEPKGSGQGDDGEDDTEGDDGDGDGGDTEGEDGDDGDGGTEGGDDDDGNDTEGGDGPGGGDGPKTGDGNDADTLNRVDLPQGAQDKDGAGGSGQGVAEAGEEDPDDGFDEADLDPTYDDLSKVEQNYEQQVVARAEADERVTTRVDAGAHGKMRVIFK